MSQTAAVASLVSTDSAVVSSQDRGRLGGVDSIRAVCALTVVLGHVSLFAPRASQNSILITQVARVEAAFWNGPAAVIVFFIISGFCIHLPFRTGRPINLASFMTRRFLRVGIPVLLVTALAQYVLKDADDLWRVTWSILCEMIYYALYPALRAAAVRIGWRTLIAVTFCVSFILSLANLPALSDAQNAYTALGPALTWVIGLPCWLLGCWLAECVNALPSVTISRLWLTRIGILLLAVLLRIIKFHVHSAFASNCITLNLFAFPSYQWLVSEIGYYKQHRSSTILEWMGTWSYSLYLIHVLATGIVGYLHLTWLAGLAGRWHIFVLFICVAFSYVFYLLIEKPSHKFAVKVSRAIAKSRLGHLTS